VSLFWEVQSLKDREKLFEYLYQFNPTAAEKTDTIIVEKTNLLLEQPELGVQREGINGRLLIIPEVSLVVSYFVDAEQNIRVMRVLHQKQKYPT
jgi:addiction module RelE/StbE family toxin